MNIIDRPPYLFTMEHKMTYLWLTIAIVAEVIATSSLKLSEGLPSVATVLFYAVAFYCLSLTMRTIPTGVIYAIWSGAGIVLIGAVGWLFLGQKLDWPALAGMALIVLGVLVINLFSKSVAH
jgi:small multidrug resistance pump